MAFETNTLVQIHKKFNEFGATAPNVWWEHGTLWADTDKQEDVNLIIEGLEETINPKYKVQVSKLKATKTEPWDQYAFDITAPEGI